MTLLHDYSPKRIYLRWKVRRDERFLLQEGLREAHASGLEINVATEYIIDPKEKKGGLYLPPEDNQGNVDITPLIQLGAKTHPKIARRWLENRKRLV